MKESVTRAAPPPRDEQDDADLGQPKKLFARHMESMTSAASLVAFHLKPQAARLLYDTKFLSSLNQEVSQDALSETVSDLSSSAQELSSWAQRLSRFAERGAQEREPIAVGELLSAAHKLLVSSQRLQERNVGIQPLNAGAVTWTNYLLAVPLVAEAVHSLSLRCPELEIQASFYVQEGGARVGICLRQAHPAAKTDLYPGEHRPFDPLGDLSRLRRGVESIVAKELDIGMSRDETIGDEYALKLCFPARPKLNGRAS